MGKDERSSGWSARSSKQKGFVANLERLLLAVDDSPNGKFASRVAGLLAGARGMPITVLHVGARAKAQEKKRGARTKASRTPSKMRAQGDRRARSGKRPRDVEVTTRTATEQGRRCHRRRSREGLRSLGGRHGQDRRRQGRFDSKIENVTEGFKGPIAIVAAKGTHLKQPAKQRGFQDIGAGVRQRRLAARRRNRGRAGAGPDPQRRCRRSMSSTTRDKGVRRGGASVSYGEEEGVLKDAARCAARYDVECHDARSNGRPEAPSCVRSNAAAPIWSCWASNRIHGESLSFGGVAAAVLRESRKCRAGVAVGFSPAMSGWAIQESPRCSVRSADSGSNAIPPPASSGRYRSAPASDQRDQVAADRDGVVRIFKTAQQE